MVLLGLAYSLAFTAIWTGVIYVITPELYGKAFATMISLYNLMFTFSPIIVGILRR